MAKIRFVSLATLQKEYGLSDTKALLETACKLKLKLIKAWNEAHKLVWAISEADSKKLRTIYGQRSVKCS